MRIIAGEYKGRILSSPKGLKIRPTSQKVKEALFSILGEGICGASFLELFAGSGSVGIEAKSRGAREVILVENNRVCIKAIEANLKKLNIFNQQIALWPVDTEEALRLLHQKNERFDFVFLDPPYHEDRLKNSLINLSGYDILNRQSVVIAEHGKGEVLPHLLGRLRVMFSKQYGDTILTFYQNKA